MCEPRLSGPCGRWPRPCDGCDRAWRWCVRSAVSRPLPSRVCAPLGPRGVGRRTSLRRLPVRPRARTGATALSSKLPLRPARRGPSWRLRSAVLGCPSDLRTSDFGVRVFASSARGRRRRHHTPARRSQQDGAGQRGVRHRGRRGESGTPRHRAPSSEERARPRAGVASEKSLRERNLRMRPLFKWSI